MATFSVNDTLRRAILTGNGSTTSFAFSFQVNEISDIKVYVDGVLKTQGTGSANYAVQNGSGGAGLSNTGTGSVVFVTAPTNATTITILSDIPLARTSLYTSGGNVTASSLENDFDTLTMAIGDREERDARSLQAPVQDPTSIDMTLPAKASRLGKLLGFNSSTGNPEATFTTADGQTLTNIASDIATLADIEDGTDATDAIQTVASVSTAVSNVSSISTALSAVNSNSTNINAVNSNSTNINKVATIDANVTKVADIDTDVTKVANIDSNVTTVAGKASLITSDFSSGMSLVTSDFVSDVNTLAVTDVINDINTLATTDIVSDLNTLATTDIVSDINTLATSDIVSDLNTLATSDIVSDINTLATSDIVSDLNSLATSDFISDLNAMATTSNINNLSTVASNVTGVNSFSQRYRTGSSNPTSDNDVGDLFFNTTENELRTWNGSAWQTTALSLALQNNVNIVAGEITSTEDLGSITNSIDTSSGNNIDTVANAISNINTVAGVSSSIPTVATNISTINSVATTIAGTQTFAVTVAGGKFVIDGDNNPTLSLVRGFTYTFDVSNSSVAGHPLAFKNGSSSYTTGVTSSGTAGQAGAKVTFAVPTDAPATGLLYYCTVHGNNMGNTITTTQNDIAVVVQNIGEVNGFASRYRIASSAPTTSLDEGDLYYNTSTNSLNYYNGSTFVAVVAGAMTSLVIDTTPQLGGSLDVNGNSIVSVSNGDITLAPHGNGEINLNGTVNTDNLTIDFGSIA